MADWSPESIEEADYLAALELFETKEFKREDREESLSVQSSSDEDFLAALDHYEQKLLATGPVKEDEAFLVNYGQEIKSSLPCVGTRFGPPVSEEDIISKMEGTIPKSTRNSTKWAVKVWDDWVENRKNQASSPYNIPPNLVNVTNAQLSHWMSRMIMEVRNQKGQPYSGTTLYGLCAGIQRFVRDDRIKSNNFEALDIYKGPEFAVFRGAFDCVLKDLHSMGVGTATKQAEVITSDIEDRLWSEGVLGSDTPQKLLDTLIFCFGLNYALRSGKEHRDLQPDMLTYEEPTNARPYLQYNEFGSKNNAGGLKERRVTNKAVKIFTNYENKDRCVVSLYHKYMSLRPPNAPNDIFYLQPLRNPQPNCWYKASPVGHNTLSATVRKLTACIGEDGYFTNHSLRRTCATRLYENGLDEQRIMAVTGHRSKDGVRTYKKISRAQEEEASDILQNNCKKAKIADDDKENLPPHVASKPSGLTYNISGCHITINH